MIISLASFHYVVHVHVFILYYKAIIFNRQQSGIKIIMARKKLLAANFYTKSRVFPKLILLWKK